MVEEKQEGGRIPPPLGKIGLMDMKIWICDSCSVVPKKADKILKNVLDLQQELKSLKSNVEEILKTQRSKAGILKQRSCHLQISKRRLLNLLETTPAPFMMIVKVFVKKIKGQRL